MIKNTTQSGFFIIDKPKEITSHDAVAAIRKRTTLSKVGHTGTLDPFATGILLIPINSATRLTPYTHGLKKTYEATITLGATTSTDDNTSDTIVAVSDERPTQAAIETTLRQFIGEIKQVPPQYAAIKIKGKKMYEYARAGQRIEAAPRDVTIETLDIINYTYPHLTIRTTVSTGTYIRALARDIGQALKTGAHLSALRRTSIGNFTEEGAVELSELTAENWPTKLRPSLELVAHLPAITLTNENVAKFQQGRAVPVPHPLSPTTSKINSSIIQADQIAVVNENRALVGIGIYDPLTCSLSPKTVLTF